MIRVADRLTATIILHQIGAQAPYFSVTGEERSPRSKEIIACGCLHEQILAAWPDLADVVALHLSDIDGVPMHAVENGYYWLAGCADRANHLDVKYHGRNDLTGRSHADCLRVFAAHCRVSDEEAAQIVDVVAASPEPKATWRILCSEMRPRWKSP